MNIEELYKQGKITKGMYYTFLLFAHNQMGANWLSDMIRCTFFEETIYPQQVTGAHAYVWRDGRESLLREIINMIKHVEGQLEANK